MIMFVMWVGFRPYADRAEIDILSKKTKIFMEILIKSSNKVNQKMAIIKKFRLKVLRKNHSEIRQCFTVLWKKADFGKY